MPERDDPDDLPLFRDAPEAVPQPTVQPWRALPADSWIADEAPSPAALEGQSPDLLMRDLEFLRAMELHGEGAPPSDLQRFQEMHEELVRHLVRLRADADDGTVSARPALETLKALAELRGRILAGLDPGRLRKVMTAERRVRIIDYDIEQALSMAEFELAEERGELVTVEFPGPGVLPIPPGLIGLDMVEGLARMFMDDMRAEQERRPLPARGGLGGLLQGLPVVWLDAIWDALDLGPGRPRRRKERERTLAERLTESGTLPWIVSEKLSGQERRLLAYLLGRGGRASATAVTRSFGSDRGDGWFWNEEPPTSSLGRVRLHGLAFVGAATEERRSRTVLVPRELREALVEALAASGDPDEGESALTLADESVLPLRADVLEALEAAFPDGVVEPIWDEDDLDDTHAVLRHRLTALPGAHLLYERPVGGEHLFGPGDEHNPGGWAEEESDGWDEEEDMEGWDDVEWSYALFFLSPRGEAFRLDIEGETLDEDGRCYPTRGVRRIGYAVAVSGVAPFALLRVRSLDSEEGVGTSAPDIEPRYFDDAGRPQAEDQFLLAGLGEEARARLNELREQITSVLEALAVAVLEDDDARQPVPWLEADDGVLVGGDGESLSVEDAFFFRCF